MKKAFILIFIIVASSFASIFAQNHPLVGRWKVVKQTIVHYDQASQSIVKTWDEELEDLSIEFKNNGRVLFIEDGEADDVASYEIGKETQTCMGLKATELKLESGSSIGYFILNGDHLKVVDCQGKVLEGNGEVDYVEIYELERVR